MNRNYQEFPAPMGGGVIWKGNDLAGSDSGFSSMKQFVEEHPHDDWSLSIFDSLTSATIEIECSLVEMPTLVSYVYNLEHASPIVFIGENCASQSYVVGMTCTRGRIDIPGKYKAENGKLIAVKL